jgi:hypothetical protein
MYNIEMFSPGAHAGEPGGAPLPSVPGVDADVGVAVVLPPSILRQFQGGQYNCHPNEIFSQDYARLNLPLTTGH